MYIPEFIVGVVSCILIEIGLLLVYYFYDEHKKGK